MFIATSFTERIATKFCTRDYQNGYPAVLWYFHLDEKKGCLHVNFVEKSQVQGEDEFLFSAYSVFTVQSVNWKDNPTGINPHEIHLLVDPDNQLESEDLPLSPWG